MDLRLMASMAAILIVSSSAHAGVAEELTAAINKCAALADDGMRHACYDQLPNVVKALTPVAAAPSAAAAPRAVAAQVETPPPPASQPKALSAEEEKGSSTGIFDIFSSEPVPADHISARVESFTYNYGAFVVTLDNGQVWAEVAATGGMVPLSKDRKDQVTIWHSRLGYDVLKFEGRHTKYHVRRIR